MSKNEKAIARKLQEGVAKSEPVKVRGTLAEYYEVYRAHMSGDYSKVFSSRLYVKYGFEYCVLLEVLQEAYPI